MCGKGFYAMNNLELLIFLYLWLMPKNTFLKLSYSSVFHLFIKPVCFQRFLSETLAAYRRFRIFHVFLFSTLNWYNIIDDLFLNKRIFYLTVLFCFQYENIVHTRRWKAYEKTNNLVCNMLKSVANCGSYCPFFNILGIIKLTKNATTTVKRFANELVSPITMGHLIEKSSKWLVTICARNIFWGVQNCISGGFGMAK